ncbi:MAG: thioredoxin domain-containing protein [Arachnia sp.]
MKTSRLLMAITLPALVILPACSGADPGESPAAASASATDSMEPDPAQSAAMATPEASMTSESSSGAEPMAETDMSEAAEPMAEDAKAAGQYLDYNDYAEGMGNGGNNVVLFFHATWCPSCQATDESLTTDGVPAGLTVVKVDFDKMTQLRNTYAITQQHTFVLIDDNGSARRTWTGSATGEQIKAKATQ